MIDPPMSEERPVTTRPSPSISSKSPYAHASSGSSMNGLDEGGQVVGMPEVVLVQEREAVPRGLRPRRGSEPPTGPRWAGARSRMGNGAGLSSRNSSWDSSVEPSSTMISSSGGWVCARRALDRVDEVGAAVEDREDRAHHRTPKRPGVDQRCDGAVGQIERLDLDALAEAGILPAVEPPSRPLLVQRAWGAGGRRSRPVSSVSSDTAADAVHHVCSLTELASELDEVDLGVGPLVREESRSERTWNARCVSVGAARRRRSISRKRWRRCATG